MFEKPSNKAFLGAWKKGRQAAIDGLPQSACPYRDIRCGFRLHIVTFSRAFARYWQEGWTYGEGERENAEKAL